MIKLEKKRNRKKKKKENENNIEDNKNLININNQNQEENKENKVIELKKFISIDEDEELTKIKKGYIKLETSDNNNLCESSGSENNCDSKPLLVNNGDIKQIKKIKKKILSLNPKTKI